MIIALAFASLAAATASADPAQTSRLGWVTNGNVSAAAAHGDRLYVGGPFTRVAPRANLLGSFYRVSLTNGAPAPGLPLVDGVVRAIEPDGAGGYFIGGRFSRVGGLVRTALAHVLADGHVDPAFAPALDRAAGPNANAEVLALRRAGGTLYVGGAFDRVNQDGRIHLAALDAATGNVLPWFPAAGTWGRITDALVVDGSRIIVAGHLESTGSPVVSAFDSASAALAWSTSLGDGAVHSAVLGGGRLIVGGAFDMPAPVSSRAVVSVNPADGQIDTAWFPETTDAASPAEVYAMSVVGSTLYTGGRFSTLGAQARLNVAAIDIESGTLTAWAPAVDDAVYALTPAVGGGVHLGGAFRHVAGLPRDRVAEIDAIGAVTSWLSGAYATSVYSLVSDAGMLFAGGPAAVSGGVAREGLAAFDLTADDVLTWSPAWTGTIRNMAVDDARVFIDGWETGAGESRLAAFDAATGAVLPWTVPSVLSAAELITLQEGLLYVRGSRVGLPDILTRLDAATGDPDPSWRVDSDIVDDIVFADSTVYVAGRVQNALQSAIYNLAAIDVSSPTIAPWQVSPAVNIPPGATLRVGRLAVSGRTLYAKYDLTVLGAGALALDRVSGHRVNWDPPLPLGFPLSGVEAVDGQVLLYGAPRRGPAVLLSNATGNLATWDPALMAIDPMSPALPSPRALVTPTDVILVGYESVGAEPAHGVAVFARQAPAVPSDLEALVVDERVHLSWRAAQPAPAGYTLEVGSHRGATDLLAQPVGPMPALDAVAPNGTYFVRIRGGDATSFDGGLSNEVAVVAGCRAPPGLPPTRVAPAVAGADVTLTWLPPPFTTIAYYVVEAGSVPGAANLARLAVPGDTPSLSVTAPPGSYYVRVRGVNGCGTGPASPDVRLTVGAGASLPAPAGLDVEVAGSTVTVRWDPVAGAIGYQLEAGTRPGLADATVVTTTNPVVGPVVPAARVTYYVRVRAIGPAGAGPPSQELAVTVP
ncbi:MAG: PQQ-binding-like beta-propeller repeat protein [Vicinamibacterales bacterium]